MTYVSLAAALDGGVNPTASDACTMQISDLDEWVRGVDEASVAPLLATLQQTLDSFVEIGPGYLPLDRPSGTLSGGEAQRVKMIRARFQPLEAEEWLNRG